MSKGLWGWPRLPQRGRCADSTGAALPYPPLPTASHDPLPLPPAAYKGASDLFIDSNTQLALAAAKRVSAEGGRHRPHV